MGRWSQIRLLVWKNYVLQFRRPIGTAIELVVPIFGMVILIIIRGVTDSRLNQGMQCMSTFDDDALTAQFQPSTIRIAYAPANNSDVEFVMEHVHTITGIIAISYSTEEAAVEAASDHIVYIGALIFTDVQANGRLSDKVAYSIRAPHSSGFALSTWNTDKVYRVYPTRGPRRGGQYFTSGFIHIENAVNQAIIALKVKDHKPNQNRSTLLPTLARQFPFPSYDADTFSTLVRTILPLVMVIAFIYTAGTVVKELVLDKEERLKETMKMMGLDNWLHALAWFIKQFSFNLISVVLMTLIAVVKLNFGNVFKESNGFLIFLFFLIFSLAGIAFMFMISAFFSKAKLGMLFGYLLWFTTFFPYLILSDPDIYAQMDRHTKSLSCLFSNLCMGFVVRQILVLETKGVGVQLSNISGTIDDDFTIGEALGLMSLDVLLYFLITWYVEAVFPGEYGIPQPWYFPFTKSYWLGSPPTDETSQVNEFRMEERRNFEEEPTDMTAGIKIINLRKIFKGNNGRVIAVDGISLNMFKGHITALLGHNGAGKTTTMSMLTGLFLPTSGDAFVNGSSIRTNMIGVRKSLGICPQHNVLFDRLTVKEHLSFFLSLKGHPKGREFDEKIASLLDDLQLSDKAKCVSRELSGGMKRKLSVGIALIGDPQIVVLDEPTAGMDPSARRSTWDLLIKYKTDKTMLLTTHYMEEADVLGDRIAIMVKGRIRCVGSSYFLKERYGVGYHLTMEKGEQCESKFVTKYLKEKIPTVKLNSDVGRELSYLLPRNEIGKFPNLFKYMEDEIGALGVESFGLSLTTMEEVFLRVGNRSEETIEAKLHRRKSILIARENTRSIRLLRRRSARLLSVANVALPTDRLSGSSLWLQQFYAVYAKRFLNSRRDYGTFVSQMLLPIVFTVFALLVVTLVEFRPDDPPGKLSLGNFGGQATGYVADFAQEADWRVLESAEEFLTSIGVTTVDALNTSLAIKSRIGIAQTEEMCCKNKYFILNEDCIDIVTAKGQDFADDCAFEDLGYKSCTFNPNNIDNGPTWFPTTSETSCLEFSKSGRLSEQSSLRNPLDVVEDVDGETQRCPLVPTDYINSYDTSYFMQDVLERSADATDGNVFFDEKLCAFTLVSPPPINYSVTPSDPDGVGVWATVWYSNQHYQIAPAAVSAFANIQLRYFLRDVGVTDLDRFGIEVTNHPLPKTPDERIELVGADVGTFVLPFLVSFGMAFLSASFSAFPIAEKKNRAKHMQFLSGLTPSGYWLATFAWDLCNYFLPALSVLILFASFQLRAFTNTLGLVVLLLILNAWASLPLVYFLSFFFTSPYTGFAITILIFVLSSLLGNVLVYLFLTPGIDLLTAADVCRYIFFIQPNFAFSQSLSNLYRNSLLEEACSLSDVARLQCIEQKTFVTNELDLTAPGIGVPVIYLFIEGIVYFALVFLMEYRFFIPIPDRAALVDSTPINNEDSDVASERDEVTSPDFDATSAIVVVKNLTKRFRRTGRPAVDRLTFSIPHGECFGLLGLNGAGKTTTFKMLTGDLPMSAGTAFIEGFSIRSDLRQIQKLIGYCPQFDALIERLTGREYLTCIARIHGHTPSSIPKVVQKIIKRLGLNEFADRTCGTYSGGNMRKLSVAIALIGDPTIVFLDEPTAGMDPKARRFLWDYLVDVLRDGRSIVLTSHSMEECEALCTRLGILINGQFKCLGSIQHLKHRFGGGISLTVVVGGGCHDEEESSAAAIKDFIQKKFPGAKLTDEHGMQLGYDLVGSYEWSYIFDCLESARKNEELNLANYSVSQATLEDVFLHFAKEQKDGK